MRVYIPATTSLLQRLVDTSELGSLFGPRPSGSGGADSAAGAAASEPASAAATSGSAPVELTAFAVTPGLREWYVDNDLEELEYAASREAARASLRLLAADAAAVPRRVVVAAEVPDNVVTVRDDLDRGVVRLAGPVPLRLVAAVHIDDADAEQAVRAATAVIDAADLGDVDAEATVDDAEGFELAWYATQELGAFLELLGSPG